MVIRNVTCECGNLQDQPSKAAGRSRKLNKGTLLATGCECRIDEFTNSKPKVKKVKQVGTVQVNVERIDPTAPLENFI